MFTIALIKKNQIDTTILKNLSEQEMVEYISTNIELIEILHDDLMVFIYNTLNLSEELIGNTTIISENEEYIYQACNINMSDNAGVDEEDNINSIASELAGKVKLYGPVILLCSKVTENGTCVDESITLENIAHILYDKLNHKAVRINVDGEVSEIIYKDSPVENYANKYKYIELPVLKFNLLIYVEIEPEENRVNKKATRLAGKYKINGSVMIASTNESKEFDSIDKDTVERLLDLSYNPGLLVLSEEDQEETKLDGLPVINNKYRILLKKYEGFNKNICNYCDKEIETVSKICKGCFRAKYHDDVCQLKHWTIHKKNCLHEEKEINEYLKTG